MNSRILITAAFIVCLSIYGCKNSVDLEVDGSYDRVEATIKVESNKFFYTLDIPKGYKVSKAPTPLFLVLHYGGTGGQVTSTFGREILQYLIKPAFKDFNAFFIAPVNPNGSNWVNAETEKVVNVLLDTLFHQYNIDKDRIVIIGYSQGAIGTWYFAMRFYHLFSAAIPISGTPERYIAASVQDVPMYVIHSRNDEVFPFSKEQELINSLKEQGMEIEFKIVDETSHNNVQGFVKPLSEAIPWLYKIWEK